MSTKKAVELGWHVYFSMRFLLEIRVRVKVLSYFIVVPMSRNSENVFYAVGRGKETGIFNSWQECKARVDGIPKAKYRKFYSLEEAEEFVSFWRNYSSPVRESIESENIVSKVLNWKENGVNRRRNHHKFKQEMFKNLGRTFQFYKKNKDFILGNQSNKQECSKEATLYGTPYISPLSAFVSYDLTNPKASKRSEILQKNSLEAVKTGKQPNVVERFNQVDSATLIQNQPAKVIASNKQNQNCKQHSTSDYGKRSELSYSSPRLDYDALSNNKPLAAVGQSNVPKCDTTEKESNKSCLNFPDYNIDSNIKKEVICVDFDDYTVNSQIRGREITDIDDKVTSCLKILGLAFGNIRNLSTNKSENLKNYIKTLLEGNFTVTNPSVNPQMEPEENVNKNCEDAQNSGLQPPAMQEPVSHQQSSQMSCVHSQPMSFHSSSLEGKVDQKSVDVLALNLRLDSFEKRFDSCLKEVGAIASEISHLRADIKEMKETLSSGNFKSQFSPNKNKDGMIQTALNFGSTFPNISPSRSYGERRNATDYGELGKTTGKPLKRKLSGSSEGSKLFADDVGEIDDLLLKIKTEAVDYASFTIDEDDYVEVYTDGAAQLNGQEGAKAGIGIWFGENHPLNVAEAVVGPPTNNTAEIQAARVAIQLAIKAGIKKLKIYTDSEFLINCATKWIHQWKRNGWILRSGGPVKHRKELEKLDKAASKISIRWEKVAGHSGIKGNETADRLANEGAVKYKR